MKKKSQIVRLIRATYTRRLAATTFYVDLKFKKKRLIREKRRFYGHFQAAQ